MTVLGLLMASFLTQGQPFLPTFSILLNVKPEKAQQRLISSHRLSTFVVRFGNKSDVSADKNKYQKRHDTHTNKVTRLSFNNSINKYQRKSSFSPVLKDYSMNSQPLFGARLELNPKKQWDMPQKPLYDAEQRLLAQYFRGQALPVLRYGNTGNAVRVLQTLLTYNRYGVGVTGRFDVLTETAVKAFQANRRLAADGIVGSRTWRELTKYTTFHSTRDPMEIPRFENHPLNPWEKSFRGNFAGSTLSI